MTAKKSASARDQVVARPDRRPVQKVFTLPTRTKPSEGQLTNINDIVRRYSLDELGTRPGIYADTTAAPRLEEALGIVAHARSVFESQPAEVRRAADHNVEMFYELLSHEEGRAVLGRAGLPVAAPDEDGAVDAFSEHPRASGGESEQGTETGISPPAESRSGGQEGTAS